MDDCIFCKIIKSQVPSYKVYEDDDFLAFLDAFPHSKGHTVVIPKKHVLTILDLNDNEVGKLNIAVKKTTQKLLEVLSPDGFNIGWNHNKAGGQVVDHLHVHILTRWDGDGGGSIHSIIKSPQVDVDVVGKLFKND